MDEQAPEPRDESSARAFAFEGNWREFAPIAFSNLLLTIVTLGIYRFWATARERRYLWSHSRFIDEHLEWTGTGMELFKGFAIVVLLLGVPYFALTFVIQSLMLRGEEAIAFSLLALIMLAFFYLVGLARYRALRYRLSRTFWRGIRGGSADQGFSYGWSHIWKNTAGYAAMGLGIPWASVSLWNERWRKMSFGPLEFTAQADFSPLMKRYLVLYLAPIILLIVLFLVGAGAAFSLGLDNIKDPENPEQLAAAMVALLVVGLLVFYGLLGLIALGYYAKYYRVVWGEMQLGDIDLGFDARTKDWLKLAFGDVALVIITLGIGFIFLRYRHWKFFIEHLTAHGAIDVDALTQSTTPTSKHGEGLLDAFDMGAF